MGMNPSGKFEGNSGSSSAVSSQAVQSSRALINQIRGTAVANTLNSGIPKHVMHVSASMARASSGTTSAIRVLFHRDPSDTSFTKALVFVRGYQGNSSPVQVASGTASPITVVLNNTGETLSFHVQASGNTGDAPFSGCPTTGATLPKGINGGFGDQTTITPPPVVPIPSIPEPATARFSLMESQASPANVASGPYMTNDVMTTVDTGANNLSINPPDATNGASETYSVVGGGFGHLLRIYQGQYWAYPGRKLTIRGTVRFKTDINAAAGEYYVGMSNTTGGVSPVTGDMLALGVEKVASVTAGNWILFASNAGTVTRINTGIAIAQDVRYKFEIILNGAAATVSINGTQCGTVTTNLPTAPLGLNWYLHGSAGGGGGTCFATLEYVYAENITL